MALGRSPRPRSARHPRLAVPRPLHRLGRASIPVLAATTALALFAPLAVTAPAHADDHEPIAASPEDAVEEPLPGESNPDAGEPDGLEGDAGDADGVVSGSGVAEPGADLEPAPAAPAARFGTFAATSPAEDRPLGPAAARPSLPFDFAEPELLLSPSSFGLPAGAAVEFDVFDVMTADLDGNGTLDIVSHLRARETEFASGPRRYVTVQLGDGFGGFTAGTAYAFPEFAASALSVEPFAVAPRSDVVVAPYPFADPDSTSYYPEGGTAVADFDGDGDLDILVTTGRRANIYVYLNDGAGAFPEYTDTYLPGRKDRTVVPVDLDGDGILDLVMAELQDDQVQVVLGNGDATFRVPEGVGGGLATHAGVLNVAILPLGSPDDVAIVSTGAAGPAKFWRYLDGALVEQSAPAGNATAAWVGDFDGDGDADLALLGNPVDSETPTLGAVSVTVHRNDGGALVPLPRVRGGLTVGPDLDAPRVDGSTRDLDGDGRADIVIPGLDGEVVVLYGDSVRGLSARSVYAGAAGWEPAFESGWDTRDPDWPRSWGTRRSAVAATAADVTGDGLADMLVATIPSIPQQAGGVEGSLALVNGTGARSFAAARAVPGSIASWSTTNRHDTAALVDWDGDGLADLVTLVPLGGTATQLVVASGRPGGFAEPVVVDTVGALCAHGTDTTRMLVVDVTGDGTSDLVCGDYELVVIPGDGAGGVGEPIVLGRVSDSADVDLSGLAIGDHDGDGRDDILYTTSRGPNTAWVGWAAGTADGWASPELIATVAASEGTTAVAPDARVAIADVTGDGRPDVVASALVVVGSEVREELVTLVGLSGGGFERRAVPLGTDSRGDVYPLDLDGDGDLDLVTARVFPLSEFGQEAAVVALWRNDGTGGFAAFQSFPYQNAGTGSFRVADLNGDGLLDLVASSDYRGVELRAGRADGTFATPTTFGLPALGVAWADVADLDGDGDLDVAARAVGSTRHPAATTAPDGLVLLVNGSDVVVGPDPGGDANLQASVRLDAAMPLAGAIRATIVVTTTNTGDGAVAQPWTDTVWVSADDVWDIGDTLVAVVERTGGLEAGQERATTVEADVIPLLQGEQRLLVRADTRGTVTESDEADNISVVSLDVSLPILAPGGSVSHADAALPGLYRIAASAVPLRLALDGDGAVTVGPDRVPAEAAGERRLVGPGAVLLLPGPERYLRVRSAGTATLTLSALPFGAAALSPAVAANAGPATFTVLGAGLDRAGAVTFVGPGGDRVAGRILAVHEDRLLVSAELAGVATGRWSVAVTDGVETVTLDDGLRVVSGAPGTVRTSVQVPPRLRAGAVGTVVIAFHNDGLTDAIAPFYRVRSRGALPVPGSGHQLGGLMLVADAGAGQVIPPGASGYLAIPFVPGDGPDDIPAGTSMPEGAQYFFLVQEYGADSIASYDAEADFAAEIAALPAEKRVPAAAGLRALFGETGGSYVRALHSLRPLVGSDEPDVLRRAALARVVADLEPGARNGRILDRDGQPFAGRTVVVHDGAGATASATTDGTGRWSVRGVGEPTAIEIPGYGPGAVLSGDVAEVTLPAWASVSGRVENPDGSAAAGATVWLRDGGGAMSTVAGPSGGYRFEGVRPGNYELGAANGAAAASVATTIGDVAVSHDLALTAAETFTLSGVVRAAGAPVEGALVSVGGLRATTGVDGGYSLSVPAVSIATDAGERDVAPLVVTAVGYLEHVESVVLTTVTVKDVALEQAATLRVVVTDTGAPVGGAPVLVQEVGVERLIPVGQTATGSDGTASFALRAGDHVVTLGDAQHPVTLVAGASRELTIVLDRAAVTGTLGSAGAGAAVWLRTADGAETSVLAEGDGTFLVFGSPGADAELRVLDPLAGVIRKPVTLPGAGASIDLGTLDASGVELTLDFPWLQPEDERPLVFLAPADSLEQLMVAMAFEGTGSDDDTIVLADVPAGAYTVTVASGDRVRSRTVVIGSSDVYVDTSDFALLALDVVRIDPVTGAVTPLAPATAAMGLQGPAVTGPLRPRVELPSPWTDNVWGAPPSQDEVAASIESVFTIEAAPEISPLIALVQSAVAPPDEECRYVDDTLLKQAKQQAGFAATAHEGMVLAIATHKDEVWSLAKEAAARGVILLNDVLSVIVGVSKAAKIVGKASGVLERVEAAADIKKATTSWANGAHLSEKYLKIRQTANTINDGIGVINGAYGLFTSAVMNGEPRGAWDAVRTTFDTVKLMADSLMLLTGEFLEDFPAAPLFKEALGVISGVLSIYDNISAGIVSFQATTASLASHKENRDAVEQLYRAGLDRAYRAWHAWLAVDKTPRDKNPLPEGCEKGGGGGDDESGPKDGPGGPHSDGGDTQWSKDPNQITGPSGVGAQRWLQASASLGYTIEFENLGPGSTLIPPGMSPATAPAAEVVVTLPLDRWVDVDSVRLGEFGFGAGPVVFTPPAGAQAFSETRPFVVELPGAAAPLSLELRASAILDPIARSVVWRIVLVDPATGLVHPDPLAGFLPPEPVDDPGAGGGWARVTMTAEAPGTGDIVTARASIVFDENEAIETNMWSNTLDRTPPVASVTGSPTTPVGGAVTVTAADIGSQLGLVDIWRSDDDGPLVLWKYRVAPGEVVLDGAAGQRVGLAVRATDRVFNVGTVPAEATFTTRLVATGGGDPGGPGVDPEEVVSPGDGGSTPSASGRDSLEDTGAPDTTALWWIAFLMLLAGLALLRRRSPASSRAAELRVSALPGRHEGRKPATRREMKRARGTEASPGRG